MPFTPKELNVNYLNNTESSPYYFVTVDAGSSGSRARLYSCAKTSDDLPSDLKEEYSNEVDLGLQNVPEEYLPR